ncbi:TIR domain-containing protein [Cobetia sp. Ld8]|uniref:TIR domain-containing protein n=1 Tax=Cobetia sp. Ld8 TaxID=649154 RepID=UPI0038646C23
MYYHVAISEKSSAGHEEFKENLSKDQLLDKFITPYEQGKTIMLNGRAIYPNAIERITIAETPKTLENYIAEIKREDAAAEYPIFSTRPYNLRAIHRANNITDEYINGEAGYKILKEKPHKAPNDNLSNEVFIVHGHDELAQAKAARFLEKLGYKPIILHEKASSGRTIIEKIEHYSNIGFAIVLYTPDDIGTQKSEPENLKSRARQNVIFEHGFLIGKLGRSNVVTLIKNDIEKPNDISGVVYIDLDDKDVWQLSLAKEMKASGYTIDLNKLL